MPLLTTGAGVYASPGTAGGTTWSNADKNPGFTLSGGLLIATNAAGSNGFISIRATSSHSSGKYYCEVTPTFATGTGIVIGLANASFSLADGSYVGVDTNSIGWQQGGNGLRLNNGTVNDGDITSIAYNSGDVVRMAWDEDNLKLWMAVGASAWMGDPTEDPALNTRGGDISALTGPLFPAGTVYDNGGMLTANFGPTFAFPRPTGFGNP